MSGIVCKYLQLLSCCDCKGPQRLWGALWAKQTMESLLLQGESCWASLTEGLSTMPGKPFTTFTMKGRDLVLSLLSSGCIQGTKYPHWETRLNLMISNVSSKSKSYSFICEGSFYYLTILCIDTTHFLLFPCLKYLTPHLQPFFSG